MSNKKAAIRVQRHLDKLRERGGDRIALILPPEEHAKLNAMRLGEETRQEAILRLIRVASTP